MLNMKGFERMKLIIRFRAKFFIENTQCREISQKTRYAYMLTLIRQLIVINYIFM